MLRLGGLGNQFLISAQRSASGRFTKHGSKRTRKVRQTEKDAKYWKLASNKSGHEYEREKAYVTGFTCFYYQSCILDVVSFLNPPLSKL